MAFVVVCLLSVPLTGGRLAALGELRFRWWALLTLALTIQVVTISIVPDGPIGLYKVLHAVSYLAAFTFVWMNRHVRGVVLVGLGAASNFAAIAANDGVMPASAAALRRAGAPVVHDTFTNSTTVDGARLSFLGDVFAIPSWMPFANVFSIGDVVIALGAAFIVHAQCRTRLVPARGLRSVTEGTVH